MTPPGAGCWDIPVTLKDSLAQLWLGFQLSLSFDNNNRRSSNAAVATIEHESSNYDTTDFDNGSLVGHHTELSFAANENFHIITCLHSTMRKISLAQL